MPEYWLLNRFGLLMLAFVQTEKEGERKTLKEWLHNFTEAIGIQNHTVWQSTVIRRLLLLHSLFSELLQTLVRLRPSQNIVPELFQKSA